ncbi:MAG: hypothetical protein GX088_05380 [Clostridia bacterium]|nr:hypothetical protein [Clostridia bacterium]
MKKSFLKKAILLVLIPVLLLSVLAGCGQTTDENSITIGGKKFTEQVILVHILE